MEPDWRGLAQLVNHTWLRKLINDDAYRRTCTRAEQQVLPVFRWARLHCREHGFNTMTATNRATDANVCQTKKEFENTNEVIFNLYTRTSSDRCIRTGPSVGCWRLYTVQPRARKRTYRRWRAANEPSTRHAAWALYTDLLQRGVDHQRQTTLHQAPQRTLFNNTAMTPWRQTCYICHWKNNPFLS